MINKIIVALVFFGGLVTRVYASGGYANDGLEFILFLAGFLLIVAGILEGIDYLARNRKDLKHRFMECIRRNIHTMG